MLLPRFVGAKPVEPNAVHERRDRGAKPVEDPDDTSGSTIPQDSASSLSKPVVVQPSDSVLDATGGSGHSGDTQDNSHHKLEVILGATLASVGFFTILVTAFLLWRRLGPPIVKRRGSRSRSTVDTKASTQGLLCKQCRKEKGLCARHRAEQQQSFVRSRQTQPDGPQSLFTDRTSCDISTVTSHHPPQYPPQASSNGHFPPHRSSLSSSPTTSSQIPMQAPRASSPASTSDYSDSLIGAGLTFAPPLTHVQGKSRVASPTGHYFPGDYLPSTDTGFTRLDSHLHTQVASDGGRGSSGRAWQITNVPTLLASAGKGEGGTSDGPTRSSWMNPPG